VRCSANEEADLKFWSLGVVALSALFCASAAEAAQATANLTVTATVADTCGVTDAALSFGTIVPTAGTAVPVTGAISVTCSLGTSFSVGLGNGANASGAVRRMRLGATSNYLTYEIYKDLLTTTRFGDTGSSDRAAGVGVGLLVTPIAFFGSVASGQTASVGAYSDSVQITLYY
jgi:spore coat protein U-like protein